MPAVLTFLLGLLAFLIWIGWRGIARPARAMMVTGLLYLLVANLVQNVLDFIGSLVFGFEEIHQILVEFLLLIPIVEETVKIHAAKSQVLAAGKFAMISLFGIYELMLLKPLSMINAEHWNEALIAVPALAMHLLTATIYAYRFGGNQKKQFTICLLVHTAFNGLVIWSTFISFLGLFLIVATVVLTVSIIILSPSSGKRALDQR